MPRFRRAAALPSWSTAAARAGWVHEIKFDGYRMQLRVEDGEVDPADPQGAGLDDEVPGDRQQAADSCRIASSTARSVALDDQGAPDFAALQAALSEGRPEELVFFAFDLLFADGEDLRALPLRDRKARLQALLEGRKGSARRSATSSISRRRRRGAANRPAACIWKASSPSELDAPYRSGRGDSWTKTKCRAGQEVVIGGWTGDGRSLRSLLVGRASRRRPSWSMSAASAPVSAQAAMPRLLPGFKAVESETESLHRPARRAQGSHMHWAGPSWWRKSSSPAGPATAMVRQAAFKGLREDKPAARSRRKDRRKPASEDAEAGPTANAPSRAAAADRPGCGHGRVDLPSRQAAVARATKPPVTKLELAHYYEAVGDG